MEGMIIMGYVDIDEKLLKKIENITITEYDVLFDRFLKIEEVEGMLENLVMEYEAKCEELEDVIRDRDENYRQLENKEIYDYDEIQ